MKLGVILQVCSYSGVGGIMIDDSVMQTIRGLVLALCFFGAVQGVFWIMDYLNRSTKK